MKRLRSLTQNLQHVHRQASALELTVDDSQKPESQANTDHTVTFRLYAVISSADGGETVLKKRFVFLMWGKRKNVAAFALCCARILIAVSQVALR